MIVMKSRWLAATYTWVRWEVVGMKEHSNAKGTWETIQRPHFWLGIYVNVTIAIRAAKNAESYSA